MCGIAGFWAQGELRNGSAVLHAMTAAIRHRGPDAEGHWCDPTAGIFVGHRRLSILDVSPAGAQPMHSPGGRYVISFNGEIYNFGELRAALEQCGIRFRGHSDTEVLVAGIEEWGVRRTLERATGMFAFAVWDRDARELVLARDRIGEKPLYYGWSGDTLLFGSEIKALRRHPAWHPTVDRRAVAVFLRHNYIPAPHCIYRGIRKVVPGTFVVARADGSVDESTYWSLRDVVDRGQTQPFRGTEMEAAEQLEEILGTVVRQQMVSDVPLGAFLSGGVDSSLVVALMQKHSTRRVKTFTIGFEEPAYDESAHARAVADHLGTDHTCMTVTSREALAVIPSLPDLYDEPFSDSSQIPTYLVSKVARTGVTVSLSGDGGDETFGGYPRYTQMLEIWGRLRWSPAIVRQALSLAINALSVRQWDGVMRRIPRRGMRSEVHGERLHKLAWMLRQGSLEGLYRGLVTHWPDPSAVALGTPEAGTALTSPPTWPRYTSALRQLMYLDSVSYLPDDIFAKVDRASMAVSLETRAPMVDRRVIEFAWTLPTSMHYAAGRGKRPLRRLLDKYVPTSLIERPKMGFGMPVQEWLRKPLRDWAESLLDPRRLRCEAFFDVDTIRTRWEEHVRGERNWHYPLWDVLMFQAWQERQ